LKETQEQKRRRLLELAKASVANTYSTGEHSLVQAINTYNELDKVKNLVHEKLEEWYGIYFPELRSGSMASYAKFVMEFGKEKKRADKDGISAIFGAKEGERVFEQAQRSIGRDPSEGEYAMLRMLATQEEDIERVQKSLDAFIKESCTERIPNLAYLVDYRIAAELLAKAGSLSKLALMPASTIQLLGAEKALFKHIKFGKKPPKYGILFKMPEITNGKRESRGRIARLYATKISIAARADAFTKRFIAKELKEDINRRLKEIDSRKGRR
jgi:nucleolar protein 56